MYLIDRLFYNLYYVSHMIQLFIKKKSKNVKHGLNEQILKTG